MKFAHRVFLLGTSPWFRLFAILAMAGLAVATLVPDRGRLPDSPFSGLIEHFLAYAVVAAIAGFAFVRHLRLRFLLLIIIVYAGLLEFGQGWAPARNASALDFSASAAGAVAGIAACALFLRILKMLQRS